MLNAYHFAPETATDIAAVAHRNPRRETDYLRTGLIFAQPQTRMDIIHTDILTICALGYYHEHEKCTSHSCPHDADDSNEFPKLIVPPERACVHVHCVACDACCTLKSRSHRVPQPTPQTLPSRLPYLSPSSSFRIVVARLLRSMLALACCASRSAGCIYINKL